MYTNYSNELSHYGILGMKWGVRRYQNADGSLTSAGKARYGSSSLNKALTSSSRIWNQVSKSNNTAAKVAQTAVSASSIGASILGGAVAGYSTVSLSTASSAAALGASAVGLVGGVALASLGIVTASVVSGKYNNDDSK